MKRKILQFATITLLAFSVLSVKDATAKPVSPVQFLAASCTVAPAKGSISGAIFTPWYKYIGDDSSGKCEAKLPTKRTDCASGQKTCTDLKKGITLIIIAVIELLTRVSAIVAVIFIVYGAYQYIMSQGEPQNLSNAKSTITNAITGLILIVLAISIIQFLGRAFS